MSSGNTLLVLEERSFFFFLSPFFCLFFYYFFLILALQFDKARPDLLANLQHACHKLAANLINLITNMVFLKSTSQSGFTSPAADSTYSVLWRICSFSEKGQNVKISKTSLFLLSSCSNVVVYQHFVLRAALFFCREPVLDRFTSQYHLHPFNNKDDQRMKNLLLV